MRDPHHPPARALVVGRLVSLLLVLLIVGQAGLTARAGSAGSAQPAAGVTTSVTARGASATSGQLFDAVSLSSSETWAVGAVTTPPGGVARIPSPIDPEAEQRLIVQLRGEPLAARSLALKTRPGLSMARRGQELALYAQGQVQQRRRLLLDLRGRGVATRVHARHGELFNGLSISLKGRDVAGLRQHPDVLAVYEDRPITITLETSVPHIGAPAVWAITDTAGISVTGQGMRVAVIDSGVDYTHPDLGGCLGAGCKVVGGYDYVNADADPMDDNGHGTHVAGIIAADGTLKGVAPAAKILAYKVCNSGGSCYNSAVIAALERSANPDQNPATDDAVDVANLSLGGPPFAGDPMTQAVDQAVDAGIVVVVAAGNSGPWSGSLQSPGIASKALTVAASIELNSTITWFSSRGPLKDSPGVIKPDIAAPGLLINSTVPAVGQHGSLTRYSQLNGTSMASPHVAGAAALIRQLHPDWSPEMVKSNLMNAARDLGASPYDQGAGELRVDAAAQAPLLAMPPSLSFGLPRLSGSFTRTLALTNLSGAPLTATATVSSSLWAINPYSPLTTTTVVDYVRLSAQELDIAPGGIGQLDVSLDMPPGAPAGHYVGVVTIVAGGTTLRVPLAFTIGMGKVILRTDDGSGNALHGAMFAQFYKMPLVDRAYHYLGAIYGDVAFYIPASTYNLHAEVSDGTLRSAPTLLSQIVDVPPDQEIVVVLDASTARPFMLDTSDFSSEELDLYRVDIMMRYSHGGVVYDFGTATCAHCEIAYSTEPIVYIADTPEHVGVSISIEAYGSTPANKHFLELNPPSLSFLPRIWQDQQYLWGWMLPGVDAGTPRTLTYSRAEVGEYAIYSELPGRYPSQAQPLGHEFGPGSEASGHIGGAFGLGFVEVMPGLSRTTFFGGPGMVLSWLDRDKNQFSHLDLYHVDDADMVPLYLAPQTYIASAWDTKPSAPAKRAVTVGHGAVFPSLSFDNSLAEIKLNGPVYASAEGARASAGIELPLLQILRDNQLIYENGLVGYNLSPLPQNRYSAGGPGAYKVLITSSPGTQMSHAMTIETSFQLPSADMNPPRMTSLSMPQRFAPGQPFSATLTFSDAESGIDDVQLRYSLNDGAGWTPLSATRSGDQFAVTIDPGAAQSVALEFTVSDGAGNYLTYRALGMALRETPASLDLEVSPLLPVSLDDHVTLHISGTISGEDGGPLAHHSYMPHPITIYVDGKRAGYLNDVVLNPNWSYTHGAIDQDWTFIPTDFVTTTGDVELHFVFDLGTFQHAEERFTLHINHPPVAPQLLTPPADVITSTATLTLTWQDGGDLDGAPDAAREFEAKLWSLTSPFSQTLAWAESMAWAITVPGPGSYCWQVRARDDLDEGPWSAQRCFTYNLAPNAPLPLSPAADVITSTATLTLTWQDGGDADNSPSATRQFKARVWKLDTSWSQTLDLTAATTWGITLPEAGSYCWQVQAHDGAEPGPQSAQRCFSYEPPVAPPSFRRYLPLVRSGAG